MRDVIWLLVPKAGTWRDLSHRLDSVANRLLNGIDHEVHVAGDGHGFDPATASSDVRLGLLRG